MLPLVRPGIDTGDEEALEASDAWFARTFVRYSHTSEKESGSFHSSLCKQLLLILSLTDRVFVEIVLSLRGLRQRLFSVQVEHSDDLVSSC